MIICSAKMLLRALEKITHQMTKSGEGRRAGLGRSWDKGKGLDTHADVPGPHAGRHRAYCQFCAV